MNNFTLSNTNVKFMEGAPNLKSYMAFLRKNDTISQEKEKELFRRYRTLGDEKARDEIFYHNQRFIYSNAKIYARNSDEVLDYVNEGNIGMDEAFKKFDPSRGLKFITFAVWYIRRNMNYYLINTRDMICKTNSMKLFKKTDKIMQRFYNEHGYDPTLEDVKEILENEYNIIINDISDLYDLNITSANSEIDEGSTFEDSEEFNDKTASENEYNSNVEKEYNKAVVRSLLKLVDTEHQEKIKKLYGIDYDHAYTMSELAKEYGMYEEDMEKHINKIIEYIREKVVGKDKIAV